MQSNGKNRIEIGKQFPELYKDKTVNKKWARFAFYRSDSSHLRKETVFYHYTSFCLTLLGVVLAVLNPSKY